jgi:hypothetical protein
MSEHDASSAQPSTPDDSAAATGQVGQPAGDADDQGHDQASAPTEHKVADTAAESGGQAEPASTGDPRVDAALTRLDELDRLDVTEHAGVVDDIHRALQDTLAEEEV